jgi:hypothetical protein
MCKAVEIGKKGDALIYHPGIKNLIFHYYSTITLSSVLKPKYSLSTRNKCV